jgi:hypothetical protein
MEAAREGEEGCVSQIRLSPVTISLPRRVGGLRDPEVGETVGTNEREGWVTTRVRGREKEESTKITLFSQDPMAFVREKRQ